MITFNESGKQTIKLRLSFIGGSIGVGQKQCRKKNKVNDVRK